MIGSNALVRNGGALDSLLVTTADLVGAGAEMREHFGWMDTEEVKTTPTLDSVLAESVRAAIDSTRQT